MEKSIKEKAISLRKNGYSYSYIGKQLSVGKSTLSYWLRFVPYKPNRETINKIKNAPIKSAVIRSKKRLEGLRNINEEARKQIGQITDRDLFFAGIGLYWGEGKKYNESVSITNSDPKIIRFFIYWLGKFCHVPAEDLKAEVHIYPDVEINLAINYWQGITGFKKSQFYKVQVDSRTDKKKLKARNLPYGTVHVLMTAKHLGIRDTHRKIISWIKQIAGVV